MSYSLGVDLGTTFVAAAIARPGATEMVTLAPQSVVAPALVYLREDGTLITGDAARRRSVAGPDRVGREFKRRLGDPTPVMLGGQPFAVTQLLSALLRDVLGQVISVEGERPEQVVLTHPANWGPFRRGLFEEVPTSAELENALTITEPEAAAAHYAAARRLREGQIVAVYDLGGGTFDATILRGGADGVEILGRPEGIERLGGVDFDEAIVQFVNYSSGGALDGLDMTDLQTALAIARLRQDCVLAKESLSLDTEAIIPVFLPDRHFEVTLTRTEFEGMVRGPIESTTEALRRTLRSSGLESADLSAVLLVGGSSRIPLVARMVGEELGIRTVVDTHPKYTVALGAATIAAASGDVEPAPVPEPLRSGGRAYDIAVPVPITAPTPAVAPLAAVTSLVPPPSVPAPPLNPARQAPVGNGNGSGSSNGGTTFTATDRAGSGFATRPGPPAGMPPADRSAGAAPLGPLPGPLPGPPPSGPAPSDRPVPSDRGAAAPPSDGVAGAPPGTRLGPSGPSGPSAGPPFGPPDFSPSNFSPSDAGSPRSSVRAWLLAAAAVLILLVVVVFVVRPFGGTPAGTSAAPGQPTADTAEPFLPPPTVAPAASVANPTVAGTIAVAAGPQSGAITPDGKLAYVTSVNTHSITLVDMATSAVVGSIPIPQGPPQYVAFTPDGAHAYVSVHDEIRNTGNAVVMLDTATRAVVATIPAEKFPFALAVSPDGRQLYVPNHDVNLVSVVDTATNAVVQKIAVKPNPHSVAYSVDGRRAYIANHASNLVTVLDTKNGVILTEIPVGKSPHSITMSPDHSKVYVVNYDGDSVSVIDPVSNAVTGTIAVQREPQSIAFAPDSKHAYVVNDGSNSVSVIDTATNQITATVVTGQDPTNVFVAPDGKHAYVTNISSNNVTVLNTAG